MQCAGECSAQGWLVGAVLPVPSPMPVQHVEVRWGGGGGQLEFGARPSTVAALPAVGGATRPLATHKDPPSRCVHHR